MVIVSLNVLPYNREQWNPFCKSTLFTREMWPLIRGRNQYIYVNKIYIVRWLFQRKWPLVSVASQKGFHFISLSFIFCLMILM